MIILELFKPGIENIMLGYVKVYLHITIRGRKFVNKYRNKVIFISYKSNLFYTEISEAITYGRVKKYLNNNMDIQSLIN